MIDKKIRDYIQQKRCTLMCAGPMSKNFVDAFISYHQTKRFPSMLIASRRQIETQNLNNGYVNNWSTEKFSSYVQKKNNNIILCRDHGGPYQGLSINTKKNLKVEMENAKISFMSDIDNNFQIIHIDPSLHLGKNPFKESLNRLFELYEFCWSYAKKKGKKIFFEIGTEEQTGSTNTPEELELTLELTQQFCKKNKIPTPLFVVVQSGTLVKEMSNVGTFDLPFRIENQLPAEISVPQMIKICDKYKVMMKAHNCDYLSNVALKNHPYLGIHAINVAPEFGVIESKFIFKVLKSYKLNSLANKFVDLSYSSMKWKKWMKINSSTTVLDKALIAGHYVFSSNEFKDLYHEANLILKRKKINFGDLIKNELINGIQRYTRNLGIEN